MSGTNGGRAVTNRLEEHQVYQTFTAGDRAPIERVPFFLSTAWNDSVDCSMQGGVPGCVHVTAPAVGSLFVKCDAKSTRLRVSGRAHLDERPAVIADIPRAKRLIRVTADPIFDHGPRDVPQMKRVEPSVSSPRHGYPPPEPEWKSRDDMREVLHE